MQKIIDYTIGAFIFLSSVFYIPGQNFHDSQKILFQVAAMLFFALYLSWKPIRNIRNVWISAYLVYAIIIFMVIKETQAASMVSLVNIFLMVVLYYVFSNYLKDGSVIYKAILGIIVINIIFLIFQVLRIDPLLLDDQRRQNTHLVGLFGHPMNMGIFCSVSLPYVFSKNKWWAILVFIALLASKSYISVVLGIGGLLLYLFFTNKFAFKIATSIICVTAILFTCYVSIFYTDRTKRTIIQKITLRYDINYPLLRTSLSNPFHGYGLGTFKYITPKVIDPVTFDRIGWVDVTWNDYLGCSLEMGLGILFIFFGLFKQTIVRFTKSHKSNEITALFCSLATVPIGIMFHSYMNYINVGVICIALFALLDIKMKERKG